MRERMDPNGRLARSADWVMVRLKRTTHARLRQLGDRWHAAYGRGVNVPAPNERQDEISINDIVEELLKRELAKQERSARPKGRKRPATAPSGPDVSSPTPNGPEPS